MTVALVALVALGSRLARLSDPTIMMMMMVRHEGANDACYGRPSSQSSPSLNLLSIIYYLLSIYLSIYRIHSKLHTLMKSRPLRPSHALLP